MKVKRILCVLISVIMIIGIASTTLAETIENNQTHDEKDIYADILSPGVGSAEAYLREQLTTLHADGGVSYGFEWYIIAMLRAGKEVDAAILEEYYASVTETVKNWDADVEPTDIERVALALTVMDKDITDVEGMNVLQFLYSSERLNEGANALAYALIAIYAAGSEIPNDAKWKESDIITELLKFQTTDGGFGLQDSNAASVDVTAICVQALSPYKNEESVKSAIDKAVVYLTDHISAAWDYAENANSTAQVLLALATLGMDVTNAENGFGSDTQENILTALEKYRNTDGNGYIFGSSVNPMATVQVMQAYDAYRKAQKEGVLYWDFSTDGKTYNDRATSEDTEPEENEAASADVYVTIVDAGKIVADQNGDYVAQAKVTVSDLDQSGTLSFDEALYAAHEAYYDGGAAEGYASHTTAYGLSLAKLWGKGSIEAPTSAGYFLNNASCWSLADPIKEGDHLVAFNYYDTIGWSDAYSYFSENEIEVERGTSATLTLNALGYDANWNTVSLPCTGAKVVFLGSNNSVQQPLTTNQDGEVTIRFTGASGAGSYYVMAYKEDCSIVPTVCKINSIANSGGDAGGSTSNNIFVYIRVADPSGSTYLERTIYSIKKGTTADEILEKVGLDADVKHSAYGTYVHAIEGLAEFDKGPESGWMYRVNGKFSSHSASLYTLSNGDYVEWLYTRNLGKDLGNDFRGGSSSGTSRPKEDKTEQPEETEETPQEEQKPIFTQDTYADITPNDWYYEAVKFSYENEFMQGIGKNFAPNSNMTRAMLITILWRLEREPVVNYLIPFEDVNADEWYAEAVRWAASENITQGMGDSLFGANDEITREQMATILYRYAQKKKLDTEGKRETGIKAYRDKEKISEYAVIAMEWAVDFGIIKGKTENTLTPTDTTTRAEVASMLMRFCQGIFK